MTRTPVTSDKHTDVSRCHVLDAIAPDGNVFGECQEAIEANGARN